MSVTPPLTTTTSTAHTRSRSPSFGHSLPPPIPLTAARPSSSSTITSPISPSPSSALSASLKAFQELSLSPPAPGDEGKNPLDTAEFRSAFQHARRTSFGAGGTNARGGGGGGAVRPIVIPDAAAAPLVGAAQDAPTPGLSTSPGSEATSGSLPTPSSSPPSGVTSPTSVPATTTTAKQRTASNGASSGKVGKPSSTLLGVCEKDELAMERGELRLTDEDLATPPAGASTVTGGSASGSGSGIFAGGARWGWPSSSSPSSTGPLSPPASTDGGLQRRGSLAFASPPSSTTAAGSSTSSSGFVTRAPGTSSPGGTIGPSSPPTGDAFRMMQPLGRVVSAGAALQTPQAAQAKSGGAAGGAAAGGTSGKEGFGLFRRFSISGLGKTRPSAPPPAPPITTPAPTLAPPVVLSSAPSPPSASAASPQSQGGLQRGRSLGPGTAKGGKRRISPMGEKILRGGY